MGCGTNIVPGYNEFNEKVKEVAIDPALDMKINQLINKQFAKKESQVRNMPIGYNEGFGPVTRKGTWPRQTEKLIKDLRMRQKSGTITARERELLLDKEIQSNVESWEAFRKQDAINMRTPGGYG